jgi:hypothetical protein
VFSAVWIYWRLVFAGTIARFGKANWRFATFITYPHLMLLLEAACAAAIAFVFEKGLNALGIPDIFSYRSRTALFVALLGIVLKYTENATYVLYLCATRSGPGSSRTASARMGPAHRPLRAAPGQDSQKHRRRGNRHRRP